MDIVTYALLNGKIKDYASNVDEWLEENVDPATGYVLDRSLQMENAAAPADMVGDINDEVGELRNALNSEIATRQTYVRPNLLDNWYFGNPVNQRGQQTYSSSGYTVDRWSCSVGGLTIVSGGVSQPTSSMFGQKLENPSLFLNQSLTFSALLGDGTLVTGTQIISSFADLVFASENNVDLWFWANGGGLFSVYNTTGGNVVTVAAKLELGSTQTLCHNEGTVANPVWVLNEIPNYGEQMLKCCSSQADSNDTYANKPYSALNHLFQIYALPAFGTAIQINSTSPQPIFTLYNIPFDAGIYGFLYTVEAMWTEAAYQFESGIIVGSGTESIGASFANAYDGYLTCMNKISIQTAGTYNVVIFGKVSNSYKSVTIKPYQSPSLLLFKMN